MKWNEVRTLYPDRFVKFEILESHIVDNKEYVDDVAVIKAIEDGKAAMKEFITCKEGQFVFSTKNSDVVIELIRHAGIRRGV